jgi:hypothetical protein
MTLKSPFECAYCGKPVPESCHPNVFSCCGEIGHTGTVTQTEEPVLLAAHGLPSAEMQVRALPVPTTAGANNTKDK